MAASSLMGSKKLATSSIVAIGAVIVVVMGLICQVQEAEADVAVINLSLVPVNVTARVNGSSDVRSVVAGLGVTVLPLNTSVTVLVNLTFTNLLDHASASDLVSANATTALLITPALPFIFTKVNVALGSLLGLLFSLIRTIVFSL